MHFQYDVLCGCFWRRKDNIYRIKTLDKVMLSCSYKTHLHQTKPNQKKTKSNQIISASFPWADAITGNWQRENWKWLRGSRGLAICDARVSDVSEKEARTWGQETGDQGSNFLINRLIFTMSYFIGARRRPFNRCSRDLWSRLYLSDGGLGGKIEQFVWLYWEVFGWKWNSNNRKIFATKRRLLRIH